MISLLATQGSDVTLVENQSTIAKVLRSMAKLTATEMLTMTGGLKSYISKAEAYKMYGRGKVDKWIADGHLSISQDEVGTSSKMRINRGEIEALAEADDLLSYQIEKDNESRAKEKIAKSGKRSA
ncbi:hypothetical protein [Sphingobacterium spiritivorum]|uniref:hypothetical protein n=1 Tax=Sphingobacterium spiritivorum TaxID=258 RepID=UPI001918DC43|nr:hypothetical protein [Sphingobacterium spiritivorum]QQT26852.1 hypothetical protein I6J02_03015 [Sphingobacterium spiritivorum]